MSFSDLDWEKILYPGTPVLEILLRGTIVYIALFTLLRFILKRESGVVGITDLLVIVLLADAAQNAMADDYTSITDGIILVGTIIFWSYFFNWLGYRFPRIQKLVHPPALPLVKEGKILYRNMRRELITEDELLGMIRQQGLESVEEVKIAYLESDGRISVIAHDGRSKGTQERSLR